MTVKRAFQYWAMRPGRFGHARRQATTVGTGYLAIVDPAHSGRSKQHG